MNENQEKFLKERLESKREDLERLEELFNNQYDSLGDQIKKINEKWKCVVAKHLEKKTELKLVILAEAPLSYEKYFYNNTGTFLNGLKDYYILGKNCELPAKMLDEGILLLDMYELPIPSEYYRIDNENCLFDPEYFTDRIGKIEKLIGNETRFVFRYSGLFKKKKLHENEAFKKKIGSKLLMKKETPIKIFSKEIPQTINSIVEEELKK